MDPTHLMERVSHHLREVPGHRLDCLWCFWDRCRRLQSMECSKRGRGEVVVVLTGGGRLPSRDSDADRRWNFPWLSVLDLLWMIYDMEIWRLDDVPAKISSTLE